MDENWGDIHSFRVRGCLLQRTKHYQFHCIDCVIAFHLLSYKLAIADLTFLSAAFVKSDRPKQFPGLRIKYVKGSDPVIRLLNEDRKVMDTLSIEKWNTDSVEEFLNERLRK